MIVWEACIIRIIKFLRRGVFRQRRISVTFLFMKFYPHKKVHWAGRTRKYFKLKFLVFRFRFLGNLMVILMSNENKWRINNFYNRFLLMELGTFHRFVFIMEMNHFVDMRFCVFWLMKIIISLAVSDDVEDFKHSNRWKFD